MKRKIFLILSTLCLVLPTVITLIAIQGYGIKTQVFFISLAYVATGIFGLLYQFIFQVAQGRTEAEFSAYIHPFLGLMTSRMKKSYHTELGEFYLSVNFKEYQMYSSGIEISVYEQKYTHMIKKFEITYDGDITIFKNRLKNKLESTYKVVKSNNEIKNKWENWSGAVDTQSEREMKLNELMK
jgi:hypothetical protein